MFGRRLIRPHLFIAGPTLVVVLEVHVLDDCLADAPAGSEPVIVVEREMDACVKPRDSGFSSGIIEGVEPARRQGWEQVVISANGVREGHDAKHIGEHRCGGARLG